MPAHSQMLWYNMLSTTTCAELQPLHQHIRRAVAAALTRHSAAVIQTQVWHMQLPGPLANSCAVQQSNLLARPHASMYGTFLTGSKCHPGASLLGSIVLPCRAHHGCTIAPTCTCSTTCRPLIWPVPPWKLLRCTHTNQRRHVTATPQQSTHV